MNAIKCWLIFCLVFIVGKVRVANADTGIDGTATASSSFTMTGLVSISSLTAINFSASSLSVSTITAVSSATVASLTIGNELTIPNGVNSTDAAAFGQLKVMQIVSVMTTTATSTTGTSYVSTNLTKSITPTSSSNKILILVGSSISGGNTSGSVGAQATLFRGATDLGDSSTGFGIYGGYAGVGPSNSLAFMNILYVDSPATTSSITYTVKVKSRTGGVDAAIPSDASSPSSPGTMLLVEFVP